MWEDKLKNGYGKAIKESGIIGSISEHTIQGEKDIAIDDVQAEEVLGMRTFIGNGPINSYTGKKSMGWSSTKALIYQGTHEAEERAYSYNEIYDVNIDVEPTTLLSYLIHPEFVDELSQDYSSTFVSVDLAFTDGTYLSELDARDQHGFGLNPQAQGESNILYPNQWNYKEADIGKVAAGKTIKNVLIAYDNSTGTGMFRGSIDDIKIEKKTKEEVTNIVDYVNILRGTNSNGTFSRGNTLPAVAVPHGFNFWAPATDASTYWLYRYQEHNNENNLPELEAFSLSHQPSTWMGDRQTFQVFPSDAAGIPSLNRRDRALAFKHENEIAKPYYYSVKFENGIKTEMTPTDKAAMFKFTFTGESSKLIFDNMTNDGGLTIDQENQVITGYSDVKSGLSAGAPRMFIYAIFDKTFTKSGQLTGEDRDDVAGYIEFDTTGDDKTVTMKIVTSLISLGQAKKNLKQDIKSSDTFDDLMNKAKGLWHEKLSIIEVEGASRDELITVYSNMYRLYLYPNIAFENTGTENDPVYKYASPFGELAEEHSSTETGAKIVEEKLYVNNGFWDTYRTTWPAYALFTPSKAGKLIDGFVQHYREGGWISRWSSPGFADLMVGTSSDVAFADAYLKGVTNFDVKAFYDSAIKNAAVFSEDKSIGRKGLATSIFDGYTHSALYAGLSWAMDGYINDFAIAKIAKELAEKSEGDQKTRYETDYIYYINRAQNYVNLFNQETEFFMGKKRNGEWRLLANEFNPGHWVEDYTETNAWNMAFHTPHDGQGLANLYGGRKALAEKLDEFFVTPEDGRSGSHIIHEMTEARDVRMGMYAHSNQPSHHILYMYNYAGQPWKTQEKISEVMSRLYIGSEIGQGYPGDEDNGEMSAWYLFTAAGFYPLQVGRPEYALGAPKFKQMTIKLENGREITINAPDVNLKNKYVQGLKVNGEPYEKLTISHQLLAEGATLDFEMGPDPSAWGTDKDALLPSITDVATDSTILPIDPLKDLATLTDGVTSQSDQGDADLLFDNTSETELTLSSSTPWIQYKLTQKAKIAKMYTITSGSDPKQDLKSWKLLGSVDGENWNVLDEQQNVEFKWRKFTQPFLIKKSGKYTFYRIVVTENQGDSLTTIAEIELLGFGDLDEKYEKVMLNYQNYVKTSKINTALEKVLLGKLKDAIDCIELDQIDKAINYLEKASQYLHDQDIDMDVKTQMNADLYALIDATNKQYCSFNTD